ncbi:MFS transporter [Paenibacillus chibensis]|uniref:MFS transporter n=1 Tax=Paenibacillus chibensis TaxID=59846 RepID=A0ABU6PX55_9BACL|nr:MFS transporter [Paenibacillus chibensis]
MIHRGIKDVKEEDGRPSNNHSLSNNHNHRNKPFLWLCADQMRSILAATSGTFILSWMLYELTGSKTAMGVLWLLSIAGQWAVQWIFAPLIDRWKRTTVMKVSETVRGMGYAFVWLMWIAGNQEAYVIWIGTFIGSLQIYDAAAGALLPKLISKERLVRANATLAGGGQLVRVLALPLAGLLTGILRPGVLLPWLVLLFFSCWGFTAFMNEPARNAKKGMTWRGSLHQGMRVYRDHKILYALALLISVTSFGVFATQSMYVPFVMDVIGGGPMDFGLFSASFPLGYVLGSLIVGRLKEPGPYMYVMMSAALFGGGLTYLLLGSTTHMAAALCIEAAAGVLMPFWNVFSSALYYRTVPESVLGQVLAVRSLLTRAMTPLGIMYGTFCAERFGVPQLFITVGLFICLVSGMGLMFAGNAVYSSIGKRVPPKDEPG